MLIFFLLNILAMTSYILLGPYDVILKHTTTNVTKLLVLLISGVNFYISFHFHFGTTFFHICSNLQDSQVSNTNIKLLLLLLLLLRLCVIIPGPISLKGKRTWWCVIIPYEKTKVLKGSFDAGYETWRKLNLKCVR